MDSAGSVSRYALDLASPDRRVRAEAARQIWERYSRELLILIRRHLDARIRRREDEDDVLQSMYQSFCRYQQSSDRPLRSRDDLWRMLVTFAIRKVRTTAQHNRAARRDYRREVGDRPGADQETAVLELMARAQPTPEEVIAVSELLQKLPEDLRRIALLRLDGNTNKEIAVLIGRCERAVELKLQRIRGKLTESLDS